MSISTPRFIFCLVFLFLNFSCRGEGSNFRIVGGRKASTVEFPYQVSLEQWTTPSCGGTIIHKDFVLTAAHCVKMLENFQPTPSFILRVRVGNDVSGTGGTTYEVSKIIPHEKYSTKAEKDQYDIAILKLKSSIEFTDRVNKISMVKETPKDGDLAWITGYGRQDIIRRGITPNRHLMAIRLPIIGLNNCKNLLPEVAEDMICAGQKTGHKDACLGDSGGPLVVKEGLAGVVAWGIGCGREGLPGVYTNVAFYRKWIDEKIQLS